MNREKREGKERKGKQRKGNERKGKERKGKERKGKERKGKERTVRPTSSACGLPERWCCPKAGVLLLLIVLAEAAKCPEP
jgi:hypothetical protein